MKNKTALSAALICVIVNSVLTLLSTSAPYFAQAGEVSFLMYFKTGFLWLFTAVALIFVLLLLCKKQGVSLSGAFKDSTARKAVGLILILGIFMSLPSIITSTISSIRNITAESDNQYDLYYVSYLNRRIIKLCITLFLYVLQIIIGLYLFTNKRKKNAYKPIYNSSSAAMLSIVLFYILVILILSLVTAIAYSISLHPPYLQFARILNNSWALLLNVATIVFLYFIAKKYGNGSVKLLNDDTVKFSAALLIGVSGLLSFSSIAPTAIIDYIFFLHPSGGSDSMTYHVEGDSSYYIFALLIPILQILFGIYLLKRRNGAVDSDDSEPDNSISKES